MEIDLWRTHSEFDLACWHGIKKLKLIDRSIFEVYVREFDRSILGG